MWLARHKTYLIGPTADIVKSQTLDEKPHQRHAVWMASITATAVGLMLLPILYYHNHNYQLLSDLAVETTAASIARYLDKERSMLNLVLFVSWFCISVFVYVVTLRLLKHYRGTILDLQKLTRRRQRKPGPTSNGANESATLDSHHVA